MKWNRRRSSIASLKIRDEQMQRRLHNALQKHDEGDAGQPWILAPLPLPRPNFTTKRNHLNSQHLYPVSTHGFLHEYDQGQWCCDVVFFASEHDISAVMGTRVFHANCQRTQLLFVSELAKSSRTRELPVAGQRRIWLALGCSLRRRQDRMPGRTDRLGDVVPPESAMPCGRARAQDRSGRAVRK